MKARAAMLWEQPGKWAVEEVDLATPTHGEVLVEMVATGLCHSDAHHAEGDTTLARLPWCAGHEGAGIVREVGPGVTGFAVGDHVVTTFIPSCGRCRWCASGLQHLCDNGYVVMTGTQLAGHYKMSVRGEPVATSGTLGTFANWQVFDEKSLIKVDQDLPLDVACLVACGVPTGFGSALNAANIVPGDVVIVMGIGGVGVNAVQGAALCGAGHVLAVDPVAFKRESSLKFGATEAFSHIDEATERARELTDGQGADSTIVTVGRLEGEHVAQAVNSVRKAGTAVITAVGSWDLADLPVNTSGLAMFQKRIQGVMYGNTSPRKAVPHLLSLYRNGDLKLDELITRRYTLDQINQGYEDMHAGLNLRGVIDFRLPDGHIVDHEQGAAQ